MRKVVFSPQMLLSRRVIKKKRKKSPPQTELALQISPNVPAVCAWSGLQETEVNIGCCHQAFHTCSVLCLTFYNTYRVSSTLLTAAVMLSCSTMKRLLVIFSAALMIIKLSCPPCVSLSLKCAELSRRAELSKAEGSRMKQGGEWSRKERRCFISGAAEARGAEVNVDFYTWRESGEQLWLSVVLTACRDTWVTHTVDTMSVVMCIYTQMQYYYAARSTGMHK